MAELTEREMDVLYGIAEGKRIPELAADLFLSTHTVRTYRRRLYRELGARNAPHAVAIAYRRGILRVPLDEQPESGRERSPNSWAQNSTSGPIVPSGEVINVERLT